MGGAGRHGTRRLEYSRGRSRGCLRAARCATAVFQCLLTSGATAAGVVTGESGYSLRFRGVSALYGAEALERFRCAHVAVIGVGGVGSWAAEAIARTGFGTVTLVDLDEVCISNTNRQLHSLQSTVGQSKVDVLSQRCREINPEIDCRAVKDWVTPANVKTFLSSAAPEFSVVIDCIDGPDDKAAIIDACVRMDVPIVTVGATGGRLDPTAVRVVDVSFVHGDPLLQKVRRLLRSTYCYPAEVKGPAYRKSVWGLMAVSSTENLIPRNRRSEDMVPSSCDTFGTATHLTGTFGFAAASVAAGFLADEKTASGNFYEELRQRIGPEGARHAAAQAYVQKSERSEQLR